MSIVTYSEIHVLCDIVQYSYAPLLRLFSRKSIICSVVDSNLKKNEVNNKLPIDFLSIWG